MIVPPTRCPYCHQLAPCIDFNSVHNGVGEQIFEEQYECRLCGVFGFASDGEPVWRDCPPDQSPGVLLVMQNKMSASGKCMASRELADEDGDFFGRVVFCSREYEHAGLHCNEHRQISWHDDPATWCLIELDALEALLTPP